MAIANVGGLAWLAWLALACSSWRCKDNVEATWQKISSDKLRLACVAPCKNTLLNLFRLNSNISYVDILTFASNKVKFGYLAAELFLPLPKPHLTYL